MTIQEAIQQNCRRIKLPVWNLMAYIELPILPNGIGPVAKLHDINGDTMIGMWNLDGDEWEPYSRVIIQGYGNQ
jgi:hypothetical protein